MATQTSTVPDVLDAIKALLDARLAAELDGPLAGVVFATAPTGDPAPPESIELIDVPDDEHAWKSLGGRRREERYSIAGAILITRRGAGEAVAKAARDRAYAIAAELQTVIWLNARLEIATRTDMQYATGGLRQGWQENGRIADLSFTVAVVSTLER